MKKNIILIPIIALGFSLSTCTLKLQNQQEITNSEKPTIQSYASIIDIIKNVKDKKKDDTPTTKEQTAIKEEVKKQEKSSQKVLNNNISKVEEPLPEKIGTFGRLYLPTINHSVAVYYANVYNNQDYNAQSIVDAIDSAAYYQLGNKYIIADHYYQGFKKIINLNIGDEAYVKMGDGTLKRYYLKNKLIGLNTAVDLTDEAGNSIQTMDGTLVMYTCYTSDKKIMITLWDEVV